MVTNRTPINRSKFRINPAIVDLYRRGRELCGEDWEELGDRKGEYYNICSELHRSLGRLPWEEDVFETIDEDAPPHWFLDHQKRSWQAAYAIRLELDRLVGAADTGRRRKRC